MKVTTIKMYSKTPADPDQIHTYLKEAIEKGGSQALIIALGNLIRDVGMTEMARRTNLSRQSLYKSFAPNKTPKFDTVKKVIEALGYRLTVYKLTVVK